MNWLELSRVLTVVGSGIITVGLYAQAHKAFVNKSVDDFSMVLVLSLIINELVWFNYGVALREWPIILISGLNIPAVSMIMFCFFSYRISDIGGSGNGKRAVA